VPESETDFFVMGQTMRLAFERDATGRAAVLIVKAPGQEIRAKRVE